MEQKKGNLTGKSYIHVTCYFITDYRLRDYLLNSHSTIRKCSGQQHVRGKEVNIDMVKLFWVVEFNH